MNAGLEIVHGTFIAYKNVLRVDSHWGGYEATLINGDKIVFYEKEHFERIKNYLVTGHPVLDYVEGPSIEGESNDD